MPDLADLQWRVSSLLPTITMWIIGVAVVAVIVFALKALRRAFEPEAPHNPEEIALDRRYREGLISLHQYEGEKEKLIQAH